MVGYGSMLLESLVAVLAMIAAASLPPGQFFAINSRMTPEWITEHGFPVTQQEMDALAARVDETSLMGRAGGSASLAVRSEERRGGKECSARQAREDVSMQTDNSN